MKNTNTTLRELSHKYASILRKCALLNTMVLMTMTAVKPVSAAIQVNGLAVGVIDEENETTTYDLAALSPSGNSHAEYATLSVDSGDTLNFSTAYNNVYIDQAKLSGTVNFTAGPKPFNEYAENPEDLSYPPNQSIWVRDLTLAGVTFTGRYNLEEPELDDSAENDQENEQEDDTEELDPYSWENYNGIFADSIKVTGNTTLIQADISMDTAAVEKSEYAMTKATAPVYEMTTSYGAGVPVKHGAYLYTTKAAGTYFDYLYSDIVAKKGNVLTQLDYVPATVAFAMDSDMTLDRTYQKDDYVSLTATNTKLKELGLVEEDDNITTTVYFLVNAEYKPFVSALTRIDPPETNTSIQVGEAENRTHLKLYTSNLAGEHNIPEEYREQRDEARINILDNLLENENLSQDLITKLETVKQNMGVEDGVDTSSQIENFLERYMLDKSNQGTDDYAIMSNAWRDMVAVESQYAWLASKVENYRVAVNNSDVEVGYGSRIGKESSGDVEIENSNITMWGTKMSGDDDPLNGMSSLDHFGTTGNVTINDSTINMYSNSGILRASVDDRGGSDSDAAIWFGYPTVEDSYGGILVNNSTINMYGKESVYAASEDNPIDATVQAPNAPVIIWVNTEGTEASDDESEAKNAHSNLVLEDSTLNVSGTDNLIYLRNAGLNENLELNALHVLGTDDKTSEININPNSRLSLYYKNNSREELGGKIALDLNSTVNLKGSLDADIVGLSPVKEIGKFGRVNLYNNSFLNGTIRNTNVSITESADRRVHVSVPDNQSLVLVDSNLYLGKNILNTKALTLSNSTVYSTIAKGAFGALEVANLVIDDDDDPTNVPTKINVTVEADAWNGNNEIIIPFLTGNNPGVLSDGNFVILGNYDYDEETGMLKIIRDEDLENSYISVSDLNKIVADAWSNPNSFAAGSPAQVIAIKLNELKGTPEFEKVVKKLQPTDTHQGHQVANQTNQQVVGVAEGRMGGSGHYGNNGNHHGNNNNNAHTNNGQHNGTGGQNTNGNHYGTQVAGKSGGDTFNNVGMWVQGLYNHAKLSGSDGYTGKSKGIAMGMDGMVTDNLKLGFGYAYSTTDVDADGNNTDVDTHTGMLYGEYTFGNAFVNAAGTYGYSKYDGKRDLLGTSIKSDYNMDALYGQVMTGYNFDLTNISLTPETGLRYLWTKTHSYTEKPIDQHVSSSKSSTLTGVVGGRAGMMFTTEKITFMPELKLAATYDLKRDNGDSSVRLANGASYQVEGESLNRFGVETGAKIGMTIDNIDVSLSYEGRFKKDYQDHTGMINFRYNF